MGFSDLKSGGRALDLEPEGYAGLREFLIPLRLVVSGVSRAGLPATTFSTQYPDSSRLIQPPRRKLKQLRVTPLELFEELTG